MDLPSERIFMTSGIYCIKNLANGKVYIGSSKNIELRLGQHFRHLVKGEHHSLLLQRSFEKYGFEYFDIEILEETTNLIEREQYYLDLYLAYDKRFGYNIAKDAFAPTRGIKLSDEHKKKIGQSGKGKKLSEQHKESIREYQKNRVVSAEARKNMSLAHKGKKPSNLAQLRDIVKNRLHSESEKNRQSEYNKVHGIKPVQQAIENTIKANQKTYPGVISSEFEVFYSITNMRLFCRKHGLVSTRMFDLCKGNKKQHHGWQLLSEYWGEIT